MNSGGRKLNDFFLRPRESGNPGKRTKLGIIDSKSEQQLINLGTIFPLETHNYRHTAINQARNIIRRAYAR